MAGSLNRVQILGHVGRDPEVRNTQAGMKIVNLAVATSESWNDKASGERKEQTEWHRVVIMNDRLGEVAEKYLRKGSKVYLEGKLQTRKWTDQSGQERYTTEIMIGRFNGEIVLLDRPAGGAGGQQAAPPQQQRQQQQPQGQHQQQAPQQSRQPAHMGGWDTRPGDDFSDIPF